jgi:hypothetical protein
VNAEADDRKELELWTEERIGQVEGAELPDLRSLDIELLGKIPPGITWDKGNAELQARILRCLRHPLRKVFLEELERMAFNHSKDASYEAVLYLDFAPLSFGFSYTKAGKAFISGGFIYSGPWGWGGGAPTYAVNIGRVRPWSLHT